jgi:hypothetical protein
MPRRQPAAMASEIFDHPSVAFRRRSPDRQVLAIRGSEAPGPCSANVSECHRHFARAENPEKAFRRLSGRPPRAATAFLRASPRGGVTAAHRWRLPSWSLFAEPAGPRHSATRTARGLGGPRRCRDARAELWRRGGWHGCSGGDQRGSDRQSAGGAVALTRGLVSADTARRIRIRSVRPGALPILRASSRRARCGPTGGAEPRAASPARQSPAPYDGAGTMYRNSSALPWVDERRRRGIAWSASDGAEIPKKRDISALDR